MATTQQARSIQARQRLARAQAKQLQKNPLPEAQLKSGEFYFGTWLSAGMAGDANLSKVQVGSTTYGYVPALCVSVATMALSANQPVLLLKVGTSLLLVGPVLGNTTLAPQTNTAHA